jgi:hypothetical protein
MKDLFVLTADADAQAVMKSVLKRHRVIGIREITFDVDRNPMKDSGMVKDGPELVRLQKGKYHKVLLIWDYHGCGWESKSTSQQCTEKIMKRLIGVSWKDHSGAVVLVPELEEWLWHDEASLCSYYEISQTKLSEWIEIYTNKLHQSIDFIKKTQPKELFEYICKKKIRRTISPRDFENIGEAASLHAWSNSTSFADIAALLREWFPSGANTM